MWGLKTCSPHKIIIIIILKIKQPSCRTPVGFECEFGFPSVALDGYRLAGLHIAAICGLHVSFDVKHPVLCVIRGHTASYTASLLLCRGRM